MLLGTARPTRVTGESENERPASGWRFAAGCAKLNQLLTWFSSALCDAGAPASAIPIGF